MFGSHMVLPADEEVRMFGWARPGTGDVNVRYAGSELYGQPDESWLWEVRLPRMPASMKPATITVSSESAMINLTDVLVGELYMCVGASNVEFQLDGSTHARAELKRSASFGDRIRINKVKKQMKPEPQMSFEPKFSWQQAQDDNNTAEFSALCYFFGLEQLRRRPDMPVGLVQASWGATSAWQWSARQSLEACEAEVNEDAGVGNYYEPLSTSVLWYGMMHPWTFIQVKGLVLNLQGDTCILPFMVKYWREAWQNHGSQGPAVIAAQFGCNTESNGASYAIADARIDQLHYLETEGTVLAVTSDFCDMASPYMTMHSPYKREEASRLAQVAEAVTQENTSMPQAFPVVTATYFDELDHNWGASGAGSVLCESRSFGIRVQFDQDVHVRPEFQALLEQFPYINGFTLYAAIKTMDWNMPVKVSLTAIHSNVVELKTNIIASDAGITDFFPATLVYGDGAFPILPLTNRAEAPVGVFKADVPMDRPIGAFSVYKQAAWAPGVSYSGQNAGWISSSV